MERKENIVTNIVLPVVKTVVAVVVVTLILLLVLSFLLYKLKFSDGVVLTGIGIIYFIANFVGGMIIGKVKERRKFVWGMTVGITYFFILGVVSFLVTQSFFQNGIPALIGFMCCVAGGTLGGMVS